MHTHAGKLYVVMIEGHTKIEHILTFTFYSVIDSLMQVHEGTVYM